MFYRIRYMCCICFSIFSQNFSSCCCCSGCWVPGDCCSSFQAWSFVNAILWNRPSPARGALETRATSHTSSSGPWAGCWKFLFPWAVLILWKTPTAFAGIIHLRKAILREMHSFVKRLARSLSNTQVSVLAYYFCWSEFVLCLAQWECTPWLELALSILV